MAAAVSVATMPCTWKRCVLLLVLLCCSRPCLPTNDCTSVALPSQNGVTYHVSCQDLSLFDLKRDPAATLDFTNTISLVRSLSISSVASSDTVLEARTFVNFTGLSTLHLAGSTVRTIEDDAFAGLPDLRQLTVQELKLSLLSVGPFRTLDCPLSSLIFDFQNNAAYPMAFDSDLETFLTSVQSLALSATAVCDCYFRWFYQALAPHTTCSIVCSSPMTDIDGSCLNSVSEADFTSICPEICNTSLNDCGENSECVSTSSTNFTCVCIDGFEQVASLACVDINECERNASLCSLVEMCVNRPGNYACEPIVCPQLEVASNRTCVCAGNLIRNVSSGSCQCPSSRMEYVPSEQTCTCVDPLALLNSSTSTCVCDDRISRYSELESKCVCLDMLASVNSTLEQCVCNPTTHYSVSENRCVCRDPMAVANETTRMCVCNPAYSVYSTTLDKCVCEDPLAVFNSTLLSCVCDSSSTYSAEEEKCVCADPLALFNSTTQSCVCDPSVAHLTTEGNCACRDPLALFNSTSQSCVCGMYSAYSESENRCVCSDPIAMFNSTEGACVCGDGYEYSTNGSCLCSNGRVSIGNMCVCGGNLIESEEGHCVCPPLTEFSGSFKNCTCVSGSEYSANGSCLCSNGRISVGNMCVCSGNLIESEDGHCVCPPLTEFSTSFKNCTCASGRVYNNSSGACECIAHTVEISGSDECQCPVSLLRELVDGACVCIGNTVDMNGECACEGNRVFDTDNHCVCHSLYEEETATGMCVINSSVAYEDLLNMITTGGSLPSPSLIQDVVEVISERVDEELRSEDLSSVVNFINNSSLWLASLEPNEVLYSATQAVVNLTSQLLDDATHPAWEGLEEEDFRESVVSVFQSVERVGMALANVANATGTSVLEIRTENIYVRAVVATAENSDLWTMFSSSELNNDTSTASSIFLKESLIHPNDTDCAVISGAVQGLNRIFQSTRSASNSPNTTEATPKKLSGLCDADVPPVTEPQLNSVVITTSLSSSCSVNTSVLPAPVNISLYHENQQLKDPVCASDHIQGSRGDIWSSAGCSVISSNSTRTLCSCSHLTSFAVLLHPIPATTSFKALNIATKVGLSVSIICLLMTVIILFIVKVKSELPKVHRQLALSLLLTEVVFLVGVDRESVPSPDGLCTTFAVVLHYLLLVTFSWMLIEGVHMFVMLVLVYYSKKVYIAYYFLCWGIPVIIVAISLLSNFCVYGSTAYCWISGANSTGTLWGAVLVPILLVLVINFGILIIVTGVVIKSKRSHNTTKNTNVVLTSLRTAFILFPLLGLGWILGFFIFGEDLVYIQVIEWIFVVVVVLQGILIFVLNCIVNAEVRKAIQKKLCKKQAELPWAGAGKRKSSTVSTTVSLKQTWRRLSTGSLKKTGDITELSLKGGDDKVYTIARPQIVMPVISDIMEEDESFNTSDVMTEDVVSPAEEDPLPRIDEEDSHSLGSDVNLIFSSS